MKILVWVYKLVGFCFYHSQYFFMKIESQSRQHKPAFDVAYENFRIAYRSEGKWQRIFLASTVTLSKTSTRTRPTCGCGAVVLHDPGELLLKALVMGPIHGKHLVSLLRHHTRRKHLNRLQLSKWKFHLINFPRIRMKRTPFVSKARMSLFMSQQHSLKSNRWK